MYALGTLKVAWVEKDPLFLSSLMFNPNEIDKAEAFGKSKGNFMIMKLVGQKGDTYRWELLPYGEYKGYLNGMKMKRAFQDLFESSFAENDTIITAKVPETKMQADKSQYVRLLDVFVIGPVLIYAGTFKALPKYLRVFLIVVGILTILYNANNYLKNKE